MCKHCLRSDKLMSVLNKNKQPNKTVKFVINFKHSVANECLSLTKSTAAKTSVDLSIGTYWSRGYAKSIRYRHLFFINKFYFRLPTHLQYS